MNLDELSVEVRSFHSLVSQAFNEIEKTIVGQKDLVSKLLLGLLTDGHILVEGVPGLAKTTTVKTMARVISASFQRIQFTPDLLPADILGTQIYNPKTQEFYVKRGPLFHNIILADEINRAPAKVQSALLEAMQEKQITIGEQTFKLAEPFIVMATQNPIEQEGTYPLPEAQVDRFMLKLNVSYPSKAEEFQIMERVANKMSAEPRAVLSTQKILEMREVIRKIYIDPKLNDYIIRLVFATRQPEEYGLKLGPYIRYGASPRASINLHMAAKGL